jgi:hypothetical protein
MPESHRSESACERPPAGWYCTREAGHEGPCAAREDAPDIEPVARAMAEWSSPWRWDTRHPKNRDYWRRIAEAVMTGTAEELAPFIEKAKRHAA